jgi:hypothetical protein
MIKLLIVVILTAVVIDARDFTLFSVGGAFGEVKEDPFTAGRGFGRRLKGAPPDNAAEDFKKSIQPKRNLAGPKKQQQQKQHQVGRNLRAPGPAGAGEGELEGEAYQEGPGFDFIVAGFPKCGTTTLLKAFAAHDETAMAASEQCAIASPQQADARVHKLLDATLQTLDADLNIKRAFKCPTAMYNYKSIARMERHSPKAKFVIGMRHPVLMLQSFYNYRVTEIKEKGLDEPIPTLNEVLTGSTPWKGVSMQSTRFELFLMQMGKTDVSSDQMQDLMAQNYDLAIKPTKFSVFLYTVDQLEDADEARSHNLRAEMQNYLGLGKPIQPFGHENKNHAVGDAAHSESISICDSQWSSVRKTLIEQGAATAIWIKTHFIHSEDVFVANPEHFVATLESWGTDPCTAVG